MRVLMTTDTHFTDRPQDEYRWGIFETLVDLAKKHKCKSVFILGDLTDKRDNHSSVLVNKLVGNLDSLFEDADLASIYILGGNHDKPFAGPPYCSFLEELKAKVKYISKPSQSEVGWWLLPYVKDTSDWHINLELLTVKGILMHQAVEGVIGGNGHQIEADCHVAFPKGVPIFSGHIHKPQVCQGVTYVGAPYHVTFGDSFDPRVIIFDSDTGKHESIDLEKAGYPVTHKWVLPFSSVTELPGKIIARVGKHDQVKLRYLAKSAATDMHEIEVKARALLPDGVLAVFEVSTATEDPTLPATETEIASRITKQTAIAELLPEAIIKEFMATKKADPGLVNLALEIMLNGCDGLDLDDQAAVDKLCRSTHDE